MSTPLSNATVNIRIEVRLAGADGFAIVTAPMLMLDPQAHAMADLIDEALDRAAVLDTPVCLDGWAA